MLLLLRWYTLSQRCTLSVSSSPRLCLARWAPLSEFVAKAQVVTSCACQQRVTYDCKFRSNSTRRRSATTLAKTRHCPALGSPSGSAVSQAFRPGTSTAGDISTVNAWHCTGINECMYMYNSKRYSDTCTYMCIYLNLSCSYLPAFSANTCGMCMYLHALNQLLHHD